MRIALLLLLVTVVPTLADEANVVSDVVACSLDRPRFWASLDLISWTPNRRGLDYATSEDGNALTLGSGQVHDVNLDRDLGFRANLGIIANNGWAFDAGYSFFRADGGDRTLRPAGTGQLFSTFSHPGGPEEADTASALATLDYDVFDLTARHEIVRGQFASAELFGGIRWARIEQGVTTTFDGRDFSNGVVSTDSDLDAYGFRFGGRTHCKLGNRITIFGKAAGAALHGKFDNRRLETNFDGAQLLVDLRDPFTQPVFNLETALGISWQRDGWFACVGYELNIWTNLGENLRFVDDIEEASFTAIPGDLLLEGLFVRIAKAW